MNKRIVRFLALALMGAVSTLPVHAQEGHGGAEGEGNLQSSPRFSVHGYLNQGYARSDRLPIYGIERHGSWDHTSLALQVRYALTSDDHFVVQFRHRKVGESLVSDNETATEWAYYTHDFRAVNVKVGKVPLPIGLFNETRNVGTLIPFFRAPPSLYVEGIETIKGASVSGVHSLGGWGIEGTVYTGEFDTKVQFYIPSGPILWVARMRNSFGGRLFVETPVEGLRVGASVSHGNRMGIIGLTDTTHLNTGSVSLDLTREHFFLRSEYARSAIPKIAGAGTGDLNIGSYYVQGGGRVVGNLWLNAQVENSKENSLGDKYLGRSDNVVGVSYKVMPELVFKAEAHKAKGYYFDQFAPRPLPPGESHYGILSAAVSF